MAEMTDRTWLVTSIEFEKIPNFWGVRDLFQENVKKILKDERLSELEEFRIVTPKHGELTKRVYMSLKRLVDNEILIPLLMKKKFLKHYELVATAYSRGYFEHQSRIITRIVR